MKRETTASQEAPHNPILQQWRVKLSKTGHPKSQLRIQALLTIAPNGLDQTHFPESQLFLL